MLIPANQRRVLTLLAVVLICVAASSREAFASRVYPLDPGQDVIGETTLSFARAEDTLLDIARDYDLGYNEITAANPDVDPWLPGPGAELVVPAAALLPSARRDGVVVNLAEMRLYYFYKVGGRDAVVTYPIGVGQEGWDTPLGVYRVTGKARDPYWYPPRSIRAAKPDLPKAVPPGPDNPLGGYKIALSLPGYLIHGTNRPWGVGRRVSHGCIRLYPEDVARLYQHVRVGERVAFVYQPVKAGVADGRVVVEAHDDYLGRTDMMREAVSLLIKKGLLQYVEQASLEKAIRERTGIPIDVTAAARQ